jgi:hypothetical protein
MKNDKETPFKAKQTKLDGPINCEEYRHQCEIRQLLIYRTQLGLTGFRSYFANPSFDKRRARLVADMYDQWKKGNRGEPGDWR